MAALEDLLSGPGALPAPRLVLTDDPAVTVPAGVDLAELGTTPTREGGWNTVVLVLADVRALQRAASVLPFLGRARVVGCLLSAAPTPLGLLGRPEWPALVGIDSMLTANGAGSSGASIVVRFARGLPVRDVLVELARSTTTHPSGHGGLPLAAYAGVRVPPLDPGTLIVATIAQAADPEREVPPAVVLVPEGTPTESVPDHPVLGRPVAVVELTPDLAEVPDDAAGILAWRRRVADRADLRL